MRLKKWSRLPTQTRFAVIFISGVFVILFASIIALVN